MLKKLLIIVAIAVFFISGCITPPGGSQPAVPSEPGPGEGTTPTTPTPGSPPSVQKPPPILQPLVEGQWSGWAQEPKGITTDVGLAATVFNDRLCLFSVKNQAIYWNTQDIIGHWSDAFQVPGGGTTDVALSATAFNDMLYLFGKGINDKREYVDILDPGFHWSGWSQVPAGGTTEPSFPRAPLLRP